MTLILVQKYYINDNKNIKEIIAYINPAFKPISLYNTP